MRRSRWLRWSVVAALGLALLSLGLNLYLLQRLRRPERWVAPALARVLERADGEDLRFRYEVRLPAGTPLRLDLPVDERFAIRVDTQIPIDTRVRLPIRTPVGTRSIQVPVRANVPLKGVVPLHVRHTFRLRSRTQDEIVIPMEIDLRDLPLEALLRSLNENP